jgi:hypothetical protein
LRCSPVRTCHSYFDGKMSLASRYAALSKGPPQIVAWEKGPYNRPCQPECPTQREHCRQLFCRRAPQDLLDGILHHKLAVDAPHNEWNCVALAQTAQNEPTCEATKRTRHAQDSALLMKGIEFYEYRVTKIPWNTLNKTQHSR